MRAIAFLLSAVVLVPAASVGDPVVIEIPDPNPAGDARSIAPKTDTPVAMVKELVEVTIQDRKATVKGTYWLANTSDEVERLSVGFPDVASTDPSEYSKYHRDLHADDLKQHRSIANLKVSIDGRETAHKYERSDTEDLYPLGWFIWNMHFNPRSEHVVVVEYDSTLGEEDAEQGLDDVQAVFHYWLRTGAPWKGRIEEAVVRVKLLGTARNSIWSLHPAGASWQDDTITWRFENIEPTRAHDIRIGCGGSNLRSEPTLSPQEIGTILQDPTHEQWARAASRARSLGTVELLSALVEAAKKQHAAESSDTDEQ